jgi:outer membrane protein TolC
MRVMLAAGGVLAALAATPLGAEPTPLGAEPTPLGAEPTPLGAEPTPLGAEPTNAGRSLTLEQTVALAFSEALEVRAERLVIRRSEGTAERFAGRFDPRLSLRLDVAYQRLSLVGAAAEVPSPQAAPAPPPPSGSPMRLAAGVVAPPRAEPVRVQAAVSTLPRDQDAFELRAAGTWRRLLESGLVLAPRAELAVFDEDFVLGATAGVSLDIPTLYRSTVAFDVELPLRRGRGAEEVTAELGAQRLELAGKEARLQHTAARTALSVIDAYWQAAAALERQALLERAQELEREILRLGEGLAAADQIPRAALSVTRARVARVEAAVAGARADALRLRVAVADAAGLALRSADDLPLPVEPLPAVPEQMGVIGDRSEALARAIAGRGDVVELIWRARAAELRADAARLAARRKLDLNLSLGWQGFAEGGGFAQGILDSVRGELGGPLASFGLEVELPAGNRARRGEEMVARSRAARAAVERRELERQIGNRALGLFDRLASAAREAAQRRETARHYRAAVDAELARLAYGDATMIDLVTTEEQLTGAELAAIEARVEYARALAALQFELGALVEVEVNGAGVRLAGLSARRFEF